MGGNLRLTPVEVRDDHEIEKGSRVSSEGKIRSSATGCDIVGVAQASEKREIAATNR
jgi:hypothetical protein